MSFIYLSIYFFKLFVYSKILTFIYVFNRLIYLERKNQDQDAKAIKNNFSQFATSFYIAFLHIYSKK